MISIETVMTWMEEFNRQDDPQKSLEYLTKLQAKALQQEPNVNAYLSTLFGQLHIDNPFSSSLIAIAILFELERRQKESDKLSKEIK